MEHTRRSFVKDGKQFMYGHLFRVVWRDEKTGGACFLMLTDEKPVLKGMHRGTVKLFSPAAGADVLYYKIYVNGRDVSVPPLEEHEPVLVSGVFEEGRGEDGSFDFAAGTVEETTDDAAMTADFISKKFGLSGEGAVAAVECLGGDVYSQALPEGSEEALRKAAGLSSRKARSVTKELRKKARDRLLFSRLAPFGVAYGCARKALKLYGSLAFEKLVEHPWDRGMKAGMTFRQCDAFAFANGKAFDDPERVRKVLRMAIDDISGGGHVWCYADRFFKAFHRYLGDAYCPASVCGDEGKAFRYVKDGGRYKVLFKEIIEAEWRIAGNVRRLCANPVSYADREKQAGFDCGNLSGDQRKSLKLVEQSGIRILTGGPGVGKTTTTRKVVEYFACLKKDAVIKLAAPTGRAAQRLSESCGMPATTVHQLLEYKPYGEGSLCKNSDDPIEADMIVIDEMSMMNIELFDLLLDAVKTGTVLLLVGDIDQLEPIGPGAVFADMISGGSGFASSKTLTEVFRQGADSLIVKNSTRIKRGDAALEEGPDFKIVRTDSPEESLAVIKGLVKEAHDPKDPFKVQVLCPARKGDAGVVNLNRELQGIINPKPARERICYGSTSYGVGDKILMTVNNYESGYFNGDIGTVLGIGPEEVEVELRGESFKIPKSDLSEMSLAYAMTIHKSQGSEFKTVIISLPLEPANMLVKSLLYTAVTRAKANVIVVSEGGALEKTITTPAPRRNTLLGTMLSKREDELPEWLTELKED